MRTRMQTMFKSFIKNNTWKALCVCVCVPVAHLANRLQHRCCLQSAYQEHVEQWGGVGQRGQQEETRHGREEGTRWMANGVCQVRKAASRGRSHRAAHQRKNILCLLLPLELTGPIILLHRNQHRLILPSILTSPESWVECIAVAWSSTDCFL